MSYFTFFSVIFFFLSYLIFFHKKLLLLLSLEGVVLSLVAFLMENYKLMGSSSLLLFMAVLMVVDSVFGISILVGTTRSTSKFSKFLSFF